MLIILVASLQKTNFWPEGFFFNQNYLEIYMHSLADRKRNKDNQGNLYVVTV